MLGATDTTKSPDVAPLGMVMMIEVVLHESTVTGVSFRRTTLLPWSDPKPDPEITAWLPTDPVVAETDVIAGAALEVELTDTLSYVPVASDVV
jgi:hypothetical protein